MTNNNDTRFSEITPEIYELSKLCTENGEICPALYTQYQVNRGLRDINGNGVLTGLTEISEIQEELNIVNSSAEYKFEIDIDL